jgi:plasmid stability protein
MVTLTIRELSEDVESRLRRRAASNGRSIEAEIRSILTEALADSPARFGLGSRLREIAGDFGFAELDLPPRLDPPRAPLLDE